MVCVVDVVWARPLTAPAGHVALLDDVETTRFHAFRRDADRLRFLTGRALAKTETARRLAAPVAQIHLDATCEDCGKPHGKPSVVGAENWVALSIAHSADRVVIALTDGQHVGVDVERTRRKTTVDLQKYALSAAERQAVQRLPEDHQDDAFHTYWARKEAVAKASGRGLKIPLTSIELGPADQPPTLHNSPLNQPVALSDLDPGQGYRAAVAVLTSENITVRERWATLPSPATTS